MPDLGPIAEDIDAVHIKAEQQEYTNLVNRDLASLNAELAKMGLPSVAELRNGGRRYMDAIPLLLKWLDNVELYDSKSIIINALAVSWAKPLAAKKLISAFKNAETGQRFAGIKWAIGNALSYVADNSVADDLIEIASESCHGIDRIMVLVALGNLSDARAVDVLIDQLLDDDVVLGAIQGLRRLASVKARPHLERLLNDRRSEVRRQAKKAIDSIDKKRRDAAEQADTSVNAHFPSNDPACVGRELEEASTSCDYEHIGPILEELTQSVESGFGPKQVEEILRSVSALDQDGVIANEFTVKVAGMHSLIRVIVSIKNDEPTISIYSHPVAISTFNGKMQKLCAQLER